MASNLASSEAVALLLPFHLFHWQRSLPTTPLLIFILFFVLLKIYRLHQTRKLQIPGIPVIQPPGSFDYRQVLHDANAKYPNQPYMVPFQDPTVIIPAHCIEGLKNLPDSYLSANGSMYDRFAIRWTGSGWVGKELALSVKYDLSREIDDLFPRIQDEIHHAIDQLLSRLPPSEWTSLAPQPALVQIVGPVLGRLMVGAPLNRSRKWLDASIDHAIAVVSFSGWLRQFPMFLRPIMAHLLPQKMAVERSKRDIDEAIKPFMERHLGHSRPDQEDEGEIEQGRLTRWLLKRYQQTRHEVPSSLINRDHYSLCFAAIHGPTFLLVQAIIDLASYPQYVAPLRAEIDRELEKNPFEKWTRDNISNLEFVDAFCKESARMNPQGVIAWLRKTHQPITLSTGHTIPPDTLIAATNPLYNSAATPWIQDADRFMPERWLHTQDSSSNGSTSPSSSSGHKNTMGMLNDGTKFGSASIDSLIFGYGRHACPGRAFGTAMVKSIMAGIVKGWDVRLSGTRMAGSDAESRVLGGTSAGKTERPENIHLDFMVIPPIAPLGGLEIEFRPRSLSPS